MNRLLWTPFILFLLGIVFALTVTGFIHEAGHVVAALATGSTITRVTLSLPFERSNVGVTTHSTLAMNIIIISGFALAFILLLCLSIYFAVKRSKWLYFLIYPLFYQIPLAHADFTLLGVNLPSSAYFIIGCILPFALFSGLWELENRRAAKMPADSKETPSSRTGD